MVGIKNMEYEDRVVCFIDILGFQNHINKTDTADQNANSCNIDNIVGAIDNLRYFTDADKDEADAGVNSSKRVTQFSDSVVISFLSNEESEVFYSLLSLLWVQLNLVLHGILCRGGIVRGKLIHTEKCLFGPAIIDAYTLESKAALYPRIILDESIIEVGIEAHGKHHFPRHEQDSIMKLLKKDSDGMYYIDYITGAQSELNDPEYDYPRYLNDLGNIIGEGLKSKNPSVLIKYKWLNEKYSPYVKDLKKHLRKDLDKEISEAYRNLPEY